MKVAKVMMKSAVALCLAAGMNFSVATVHAQGDAADFDSADLQIERVIEEHADKNIAVLRFRINGRLRTVGILLHNRKAPRTCENFMRKSREGFYDGLAFHRAISGFLVQTGDPLTRDDSVREEWGTGGPGHTIPAEKAGNHSKGAVVMAHVGTGGAAHGSQFYVSMAANSALDGQGTVFGQVIRGMDVLEKLSKVAVDANDNPRAAIRIESLRILEPGSPILQTADERELKEELSLGRKTKKSTSAGRDEGWVSRILGNYW